MFKYTLNYADLQLTPEEVFNAMGYGEVRPDEQVVDLTNALLTRIAALTVPQCAFTLYTGQADTDSVRLENQEVLPVGATLAMLLKGAERFALFAATAGADFQSCQEALKAEGDLLKTFIADMIGTCVAEKAGDYMEHLLKEQIGGERHTNRFSPGYCGWHLSGQQQLFRLMGDTPCGITLSEVCLMTPIKSISGIIGIGAEVDEKKYGCQYCELETCYKRKQRKYDRNR